MRLALVALLALSPLAASAAPSLSGPDDIAPPPGGTIGAPGLPFDGDRMKRPADPAGCRSFAAQVAAAKRPGGTRLDQQPPGYAFLAVDRHVGGCHQVTFVSDREARGEGR